MERGLSGLKQEASGAPGLSWAGGKAMRILIAEDQRDLNQLLKKRLKEAGYSVDACFDGAAVFDYLLGAEYDALVLDIMMPKVDGIQVVRRLRREGNQVPVLLLTARDSMPRGVMDRLW